MYNLILRRRTTTTGKENHWLNLDIAKFTHNGFDNKVVFLLCCFYFSLVLFGFRQCQPQALTWLIGRKWKQVKTMLPLREKSWMGLLLGSFLNCKQRSEGKKKRKQSCGGHLWKSRRLLVEERLNIHHH